MDDKSILVVSDELARAQLVERAVRHPSVRVRLAADEDTILQSFAGKTYALAVVAGKVGRRNPLVVAEAVRLRQPGLGVLVLVDDELAGETLEAHKARALAGVVYLDVGKVSADESARIVLAEKVRVACLLALDLEDDADLARASRDAVAPTPPPLPTRDASPEPNAELEVSLDSVVATPLPQTPVTSEDVEFARRLAEKARNIDFRKPMPEQPGVPDGPERATAALRHRLHTLERQLARLAHVYAGRLAAFDAMDGNLARLESERTSAIQELEGLRQSSTNEREAWRGERAERELKLQGAEQSRTQLEESLRGATGEVSRLRQELAKKEQERTDSEQHQRGMLKQAEDTFNALREQSSSAIDEQKARIIEGEQRLSEAQARTRELEAEITRLHGMVETASTSAAQAAASLHADAKTSLKREQAAHAALLERERGHLGEIERLVAAKDELQRELVESRARFVAAEDERDRFIEVSRRSAAELEDMRQARNALESRLGEVPPEAQAQLTASTTKADELKLAAQTFRERMAELEAVIGVRDHELVELRSQLAAREQVLRDANAERQALSQDAPAQAIVALERKIDALAHELRVSETPVNESPKADEFALSEDEKRRPTMPIPPEARPKSTKTRAVLLSGLGVTVLIAAGLLWIFARPQVPEVVVQEVVLPSAAEVEPAKADTTERSASTKPVVVEAPPAVAPSAEPSAQAGAPAPASVSSTELPSDKKGLRRGLQDTYEKKHYADAVLFGLRLRDKFSLDWEASYMLGNALLNVGRLDDARSQFEDFGKRFSTNKYVAEAYFKIGEILEKKGKKKDARLYFEKVAREGSGDLQRRAQARMK